MAITNKERMREAKRLLKKKPGPLLPVDLSVVSYLPSWMTRAFKNNRYVVMINDNAMTTHGPAIRAMIQKHDDSPVSWSEKQAIKNEVFGEEATAIEYFPAESKLMDDFNIYWLWIYPSGVFPLPIVK